MTRREAGCEWCSHDQARLCEIIAGSPIVRPLLVVRVPSIFERWGYLIRRFRILVVLTALTMAVATASAGTPVVVNQTPIPGPDDFAAAIPRDLVIDHRGLGYLQLPNGTLRPYGHGIAAEKRPIVPNAPGGIPGRPGGGGGGNVISNAEWTFGGTVHDAAGRILFQLEDGWYVCSGTVVTEAASGRSIVLTAAHCIYDDVAKAFAQTAIFIPGQDDGGQDGTDWNCSNDPRGCWILDYGVVDINWTTRTFPDNIAWDYGFYVVSDTGTHSSSNPYDALLDSVDLDAAATMAIDFSAPEVGNAAHALGYSYNVDPEFMYCTESLGTEGSVNYWLGSCDLSGGSSGGPWVQPMNESSGSGPIISVNSWGYTTRSGMAGPRLHDNSANLLFDHAKTASLASSGEIVDPGGGGGSGGDDFTTSSVNSGRTWTARVNSGSDFTGSFSDGGPACETPATSCEWPGIPKKTASVVFMVDDGPTLTIYKP